MVIIVNNTVVYLKIAKTVDLKSYHIHKKCNCVVRDIK